MEQEVNTYDNAILAGLQEQRNNAFDTAAHWHATAVQLEAENATLKQQLAAAMKAVEDAVEAPSDSEPEAE